MRAEQFCREIWDAVGGVWPADPPAFEGGGGLVSAFAVSDLAAGSVGAAGLAVAELAGLGGAAVRVDRRLASLWFGSSIRPDGWRMPPAWDAVAGDYRTGDGWIRLHTNAPHHRAAALGVLGAAAERDAVAAAVARWEGDALEAAIVAAGGAAAVMRSLEEWQAHPQARSVAAELLVWRERQPGGGGASVAMDPRRPLAGIRVLDLTRVLAGPVSTRFLAGFGADVLRIDPPDWEEPAIVPDVTLGKRCARLDLRASEGNDQFRALLGGADVLVHGYRPGALDRLGFDAVTRQRLRPGLIDVCLDAYGWTGPWAGRRGFDSLVQMSAGIAEAGMRRFGRDMPTPLPVQALDHATGYIMAAAAIRGLTERARTGAGLQARVSLARMAALLTGISGEDATPLAPAAEADLAEEIEMTPWGRARRLLPCVAVKGAPMRWDRGACALGSSPAWW